MGGSSSKEQSMDSAEDLLWGRTPSSKSSSKAGGDAGTVSNKSKEDLEDSSEDDNRSPLEESEEGDIPTEPFDADNYDAKKYGPILPNGDINWDCPCLGGAAHGPCSTEFRAAFSCFHYSKDEQKGSDCFPSFKDMHECFSKYPELYKSPEEDDEDEDTEEQDEQEIQFDEEELKVLEEESEKDVKKSKKQSPEHKPEPKKEEKHIREPVLKPLIGGGGGQPAMI